jgi:hypothetical protein
VRDLYVCNIGGCFLNLELILIVPAVFRVVFKNAEYFCVSKIMNMTTKQQD